MHTEMHSLTQQIAPAHTGTVARFTDGRRIRVQAWALRASYLGDQADVVPLGIIHGRLADLAAEPGFVALDDTHTPDG